MKNLIYLLLLLISGIVNAQNVSFSGTVFKNKLLQSTSSNNIAKDVNGNSLKIDYDGDGNISITEALAVYQLDVTGSSIPNIDGIQSFSNLTNLVCQANSIQNADLSGMSHLITVDFKNNSLITINLTGCIAITNVDLKNNSLTTLDISSLNSLQLIYCGGNDGLTSIFAKNGSNETIDLSGSINSLHYICEDESQVATIQTQVGNSIVVNSLCTLSPGGNYNTISGKTVFDSTGNGIDVFDLPQPNVKINCTIAGQDLQTTTDASGNYTFTTQQIGNFSFAPSIENPSWFSIASANGNFVDTNNNVRTQNFAISPVGTHHDVEAVLAPVGQAVSGQQVTYEVVYKNKGNQQHSGQITIGFNDVLLDYVSSSESLTVGTGLLVFVYSNLLPFESRRFTFTVNVLPSVTTANTLPFNVAIDVTGEDMSTQSDNSFNYTQNVVNTPSVNRIDCLEANVLSTTEIGKYLHYLINFENTGNSTVNNIVIKTVFNPSQLDVNSIQILNSTHPVAIAIKDNIGFFQMSNIALGGPGGRGGVLLKIRSNASLTTGSVVNNNAEIYFDYATAVPTNTTLTSYQNLSISQKNIDKSIKVYPNPVNDVVNIEGDNTIRTIELYDVFGRLLQTNLTDSVKPSIDLTQRVEGVYFLKITTDLGQKVEQIVKD